MRALHQFVIVDPKQAELSRLPRTITLVGGLCVQKYNFITYSRLVK